MVPDQLESANHLANGEEAQALGEEDTASRQLCLVEIPYPLQCRLGRGAGLGRCLEESAGVSRLLEEALEVGLEGGNGPVRRKGRNVSVNSKPSDESGSGHCVR